MMNKYQEALDRRRFYNQRASRELWITKTTNTQDKDIEDAEKDFDILQEFLEKSETLLLEIELRDEAINKLATLVCEKYGCPDQECKDYKHCLNSNCDGDSKKCWINWAFYSDNEVNND